MDRNLNSSTIWIPDTKKSGFQVFGIHMATVFNQLDSTEGRADFQLAALGFYPASFKLKLQLKMCNVLAVKMVGISPQAIRAKNCLPYDG